MSKAEAWWKEAPAYRDELRDLAEEGWTLERLALLTPVELMELIEKDDELKAEKIVFWARKRSGVMAPGPPKPREAIKTGVAEFDAKTPWGGVRFGLVYGLAGEYGTGKSLFAMQIAAAAAAVGKRAFYIDTENAFQPNVLDAIAHRFGLERWSDYIAVVQIYDVWQLIAYLRPDSDDYIPLDVSVIIVDSLIGPFRPQFRGRERLALRQQTIGYLLDLLRRRAGGLGHLVVLTDQVMAVPEAFAALKRPAGGDTFLHAVNALFMMTRPSKQRAEGHIWPLDVPGMSPEVKMKYEIKEDGLH